MGSVPALTPLGTVTATTTAKYTRATRLVVYVDEVEQAEQALVTQLLEAVGAGSNFTSAQAATDWGPVAAQKLSAVPESRSRSTR